MGELNDYLKKRIEFLELLLEVNLQTLSKAMTTNRMLVDELKKRAK